MESMPIQHHLLLSHASLYRYLPGVTIDSIQDDIAALRGYDERSVVAI